MRHTRTLATAALLVLAVACGGAGAPGHVATSPPAPSGTAAPAYSTASAPPLPAASLLLGFARSSTETELAWEQKFRSEPSPGRMREAMRLLTAHPHHLGSAYDRENAQWILARFIEAGFDAHVEEFHVLFPTPKKRLLQMLAPTRFTAKLEEPSVAGDPTSAQRSEQLPTYNAYSIDGDVTAPLVYVSYGLPDDYEALDRLGVSTKGAIVLARYGHSWRGIKPKVAAEHGAIGCLIYSDPADDGYVEGDVYPRGPMRSEDGVQRGSVMDFTSSSPGDPLTPGVGATPEAKRISRADARSLTKIPVMPISYGDARPLLAALGGPVVKPDMRGALPLPYHAGPGPTRVHLVVQSNWDTVPVYDVVARIAGAIDDGQWIVRGNHHDAWVNGAWDPVSGQVALLEEARALGALRKQGWRPRRTIVYAAWDGEEPYLMGSTEWAEAHEDDLRRHAVAYINTDANSRGVLVMGGSHSLERLANGVIRDVTDPETNVSVWQRKLAALLADAKSPEERDELRARPDLQLDALGSGSDFTTFLDHTGVPTLDLGFYGEDASGIYHSIYDDFAWYTRFCDSDFVYGKALAETAGTLVMRLADAEVLPFDLQALADAVSKYGKDLKALSGKKRSEAIEQARELDDGVLSANVDPRHPTVLPTRQVVPPSLDFAPLETAVADLAKSARRNTDAIASLLPRTNEPKLAEVLAALNLRLQQTEQRLTDDAGLPRRPWYRHLVYAPGVYSGYDAQPLPGVREAIDEKRWAEAQSELRRVAAALVREAALLDEGSAAIESALR